MRCDSWHCQVSRAFTKTHTVSMPSGLRAALVQQVSAHIPYISSCQTWHTATRPHSCKGTESSLSSAARCAHMQPESRQRLLRGHFTVRGTACVIKKPLPKRKKQKKTKHRWCKVECISISHYNGHSKFTESFECYYIHSSLVHK